MQIQIHQTGDHTLLIYFDESYDQGHQYLILGALFSPHSRHLHRKVLDIKTRSNFKDSKTGRFKEIKYSGCFDRESFDVCRQTIDAFLDGTSWYRAVVIKSSELDLEKFGKPHEDEAIKKARAYKKFAEMLIHNNTKHIVNAVLLTDEMTRCRGDEFIERMKEVFCIPGGTYSQDKQDPTLRDVIDIKSDLDQYQVVQVCDLLSGCILNAHFPTKNQFKNQIREHLVRGLAVQGLTASYWGQIKPRELDDRHPKFNIWFWKPK